MSCYGEKGAYQHHEVNIGWRPAVAVRSTPILNAPGGPARVIDTLAAGRGCGMQSVRNPDRKDFPAMRGATNGYVWVYARVGAATGWVKLADLQAHADPAKRPLTGPAGLDFEVGRGHPREKAPSGCGHPSPTRPMRIVKVRETYLRYSPRGTAFHYLHRNDIVRVHLVDGPQGFAFCEVALGTYVDPGTRGWVLADSLGAV